MADEEHEDTWLYGSTNPEPPNDGTTTTTTPDASDTTDSGANKPKNDAPANANNEIDPKSVRIE